MKILILSAYDAQSHQYWRCGLQETFREHSWTILALPARHFSWRIRGNSLSWAFEQRELLTQTYDLLIATSMTDLSALRGMVPELTKIPTLVYFHENQFAYPESENSRPNVEPKILNLYTALCADQVVFNSQYNRDTFLAGANQLLNKLPDHAPASALENIKNKAFITPVPIKKLIKYNTKPKEQGGQCHLLWNHRWEYDKGPELLFQAIKKLDKLAAPNEFKLHIVGQRFRNQPDSFSKLQDELAHRIGQWGYIAQQDNYHSLLQSCDIVISTAIHDFQGIAVLEAVSAGCIPVVPKRLAYPELFHSKFCFGGDGDDADYLVDALIARLEEHRNGKLPAPPPLDHLAWKALKPTYEKIFAETLAAFKRSPVI